MDLARRSLHGPPLERAELLTTLTAELPLLPLLHEARVAREHGFGNRVRVHILSNAQNARCPEDCGYCSQSAVTNAPLRPYPWKPKEELIAEAKRAHAAGAFRYCMVASGRGPSDRQVEFLADAVRAIRAEVPVRICVSVGLLDEDKARRLKEAGVDRLNHNLNTSERRYPEICSTHTYADRVATLRAARAAGLEQCSGLIAGMGEADEDLVDVALELRGLEIPSIPVNFLLPIEGNPLQSDGSLTPERALRVLAMMRLANPRAEVRIAAGREGHLRSLEALSLWPANSLFVEGYLTTKGKGAVATYRMIRDAGFVVEGPEGEIIPWAALGLDDVFRVEGEDQILKPAVLAQLR
ncbi:MAG TPA: biotin synthase BioB [Myxococcota bacterium]|nr:biotin synthase BioB [Myxococcota bacterium]